MADSYKTIDGFAYWIENEENGVCYVPLNLCKKIMELLKEQPDIVGCKDCLYYDMVTCKDCMYYDNESFECKNDDIDVLIHHCGCYPAFTPGPNWFCAYGTRR